MPKVVVGLSGGVDSSVAALLLKQKGYEVIGLCLMTGYNGADVARAKAVADALDIRFAASDLSGLFDRMVVEPFLRDYLSARTPNPCVLCNPLIKWAGLVAAADRLGAEYVATGHYSRITQLKNKRMAIVKAPFKDQSYCLYALSQASLGRTLMPLGTERLTKEEVRAMAQAAGLPTASSADSQDICFIKDGDYAAFIQESVKDSEKLSKTLTEPGNFVDPDGKVLGRHEGLVRYTVGQRKGLGIALGSPRFVLELRPETNEVVLGEDKDCFSSALIADNMRWMGLEPVPEGNSFFCEAKIRYAHQPQSAKVTLLPEGRVRCDFDAPVRAVTPGQAVVFYRDDYVLGGATIEGKLDE